MCLKLDPLIVLCILVVGNLLHIVGLATPVWVQTEILTVSHTKGLWESCLGDTCASYDSDLKADWIKACEALAILGMLAGIVAALLAGCIYKPSLQSSLNHNSLATSTLGAAILSAILILLCVIVFERKNSDTIISWGYGYSFFLSVLGLVLIAVGGGFAYTGDSSSGSWF